LIMLIILGEEYESCSSLLCSFLHPPITLFPLRSKYSPQHPVLKHPQFMFPLYVRDHLSHPYRSTGKIIVLYILIFTFFYSRQEDGSF
jgi:hypothetical protein